MPQEWIGPLSWLLHYQQEKLPVSSEGKDVRVKVRVKILAIISVHGSKSMMNGFHVFLLAPDPSESFPTDGTLQFLPLAVFLVVMVGQRLAWVEHLTTASAAHFVVNVHQVRQKQWLADKRCPTQGAGHNGRLLQTPFHAQAWKGQNGNKGGHKQKAYHKYRHVSGLRESTRKEHVLVSVKTTYSTQSLLHLSPKVKDCRFLYLTPSLYPWVN